MKKIGLLIIAMIGAMALLAGAASAHVTVQPKETSQGKYEVFTVRVPSEDEDVPTTKIEVKFPEDVNITRFEPKAGWIYEVQKDGTDKITSVTWTTEGEGLTPTEFGQFNMQGKVSEDATEIVWKAYQTYKDGSVVEWVGSEDAEKPASVTVVNPADATFAHGQEATDNEHESKTDQAAGNETETDSGNVPLYLSIVAILAAMLSLVISLKKRA